MLVNIQKYISVHFPLFFKRKKRRRRKDVFSCHQKKIVRKRQSNNFLRI